MPSTLTVPDVASAGSNRLQEQQSLQSDVAAGAKVRTEALVPGKLCPFANLPGKKGRYKSHVDHRESLTFSQMCPEATTTTGRIKLQGPIRSLLGFPHVIILEDIFEHISTSCYICDSCSIQCGACGATRAAIYMGMPQE